MSNIYNRAEVINERFINDLKNEALRKSVSNQLYSLASIGLTKEKCVDILETQMMSRCLDLKARELKNSNQCYYTIGSSGHEGNAIVADCLKVSDPAFLHYRSGAFFIQRAKKKPGSTPLYDILLSLVASSEDPISGGRHKVFGSKELNIPPQTSTIASHLPKAVGAAFSIRRAYDLKLESPWPSDSIVVCSFGDASANHATAQAAFNTAGLLSYQGLPLPLLFVCEDNDIGISVPTPQGWIQKQFKNRVGLNYFYANSLNIFEAYKNIKEATEFVRKNKKPAFLHLKTVRLMAHAGSDPEWTYRSLEEIEKTEYLDPLRQTSALLIENNILNSKQILEMYLSLQERLTALSREVIHRPKLTRPQQVREFITLKQPMRKQPPIPSEESRKNLFGRDYDKLHTTPLHMAKLINYALADLCLQYPEIVIFGQDVAQKGGVYNVTDGLYKKFGVRRVWNSPLDETSILGHAIGMAHNGFLPIPEIQFLAYLHNAEDQLRGEASTLSFFSQGQFTNPMVVRIAGLAYQKGFGGHFHNDNSLTVLRDLPGVVLAVPSHGADAVRMLRACVKEAYEKGRVVVFIEPIALYMTKDLHKENDKEWSFCYPLPHEEIAIGEIGRMGDGEDLAILSYGNGVYYSSQAIKTLKDEHNIQSRLIDMRFLTDVNWVQLFEAIGDCKKVLVVEECRKSGSFSEALVSGLYERMFLYEKNFSMKIIAADDCFIPLGPGAACGLPKKQEILQAAGELLNINSLKQLNNDLNHLPINRFEAKDLQ